MFFLQKVIFRENYCKILFIFAKTFLTLLKYMKQKHPITAEVNIINEQDLMVFDNIHSMPSYDEPFTTSFMTISLNLKGWAKAECDTRKVVFNKHDIAVLAPNHVLCARETSADYHAMLIVIAPTFQQELKRRFPAIYRDLNHYLYRQDIPLTDEQFLLIHNIFRVIQGISTSTAQHRKFMLGNMLETLFLMLSEYRQQNGIAEHQPTMNEEMFNRFHQDIVEHYTESREVKFYAEKQNLSAKYFATAIKNLTGVNAHAWINNYVIIQAKKLLLHQRQLNILQIATQLGFSDQAVFSRFFRNATGMSPREFKATL